MPAPKQNVRVLSMDLSLNGSAFAVLDFYKEGAKIVDMFLVDNNSAAMKNKSHGEKLSNIYFNLGDLITNYKPTDFVREKGFMKFPQATQALYKVVGVVDFSLFCHDVSTDIAEIAPTTIKKAMTGTGHATKEEVDYGLRKYLVVSQQQVQFSQNDLSDAVAVGITYALQKGILVPKNNTRQQKKKDVK